MAKTTNMATTSILALKPNVSHTEALSKFSSLGLGAAYRRIRVGPIRRLAAVYVPFSLYRVRYHLGRASQTRFFALDAVRGSLDLFEFPRLPDNSELIEVQTRNCLRPVLSNKRAEELLNDKLLRIVFQQGFFRLRESHLAVVRESIDLHVPYWLAFYGHEIAKCRVIDAVRRRVEGAKASAFFEEWLAA